MNKPETRAYISSSTSLTINNIENGRMNPTLYGEHVESISTLEKIAGALGISNSELLNDTPRRRAARYLICHPRPACPSLAGSLVWIPAFAGMTTWQVG